MLFSLPVNSYVQSESNQRAKLKWAGKNIPLVLKHNSVDVTPSQSSSALLESLANWNAVSPTQIISTSTGTNSISYSSDPRYFGPGVVAVTTLDYSSSSGSIKSGSILLNESSSRSFCFTSVKDGSSSCGFGLNSIYVGDVVSHELGHFLGLAHSEVQKSSMLYVTQRGQYSLHSDDIAGVKSIYEVSNLGRISGYVKGGNQVPVFGAHVQAISSRSGAVIAGALTDEDGSFTIYGLSSDDVYYLYISPLVNPDTMPDPFYNVRKDFCPSNWVGSFFETCSASGKGHPQPIKLTNSTQSVDVGVVTIRCNLRLSEEYLLGKIAHQGGELNFTADLLKQGQSFVGYYPEEVILSDNFASSTGVDDTIELDLSYLDVPATSPKLELRLITTSLGSDLDFSVTINGPYGQVIDGDRVLAGSYGVPNYDSGSAQPIFERRITYPLHPTAALNIFSIVLKPRALTYSEHYSTFSSDAGFLLKDRTWMGWVGVNHNPGSGETPYYENSVTSIADNRACLDAPYTYKVKPNPVSGSAINGAINGTDDTGQDTKAAPACGNLQDPGDNGGGPGGMAAGLIVGLLLALLFGKKNSKSFRV